MNKRDTSTATVVSGVMCGRHNCNKIRRGGEIVCLKCEDEVGQKVYHNSPGHAQNTAKSASAQH